jgi:glutaredoxin-related protein
MGIKILNPRHIDVVEEGHLKRRTKRFIDWDVVQMQSVYNRYQGGLDIEDMQKLDLKFEGPVI